MDEQSASGRPLLDRKDSVSVVPGKEGEAIPPGSFSGKAIGVFTSGGDSQGRPMFLHYF